MLTELNDKVDRALPRLDSYAAASANAKFVEMNDDSMAAEFQPGDHLLLDPETAPRAGDVVLVRTKAGEHLVRKYVPHTSRTFFARPINPDYASLSSAEDGLTVVATMIEHRRYRRPS